MKKPHSIKTLGDLPVDKSFVDCDDDGTSETLIAYIPLIGGLKLNDVERVINDHYPAERCEHEYDCCGQWYQSTPRIEAARLNKQYARVEINNYVNC